jgi:hypothetical protein
MHAAPLLWMADRLSTATRAFPAPLLVVARQLLQGLTSRKRVHTPRAPRAASTYTMLVESDVQRSLRGILP